MFILFDTLTILIGFTLVRHVFIHILNGVDQHGDFLFLVGSAFELSWWVIAHVPFELLIVSSLDTEMLG